MDRTVRAGAPRARARAGWWSGVLAVAAAVAAGVGGARAAEAPGEGEELELPPVVVTATRIEQPVTEVGAAVTVIPGEALRRRGIRFVADALDEVPGVTVPRAGTRGKQISLFIRGANPDQTLVLVDGVRVNDPLNGGFDLSALTTDNVERIEVIRGPQSTLYGSDAMGGVVNIITRRGLGPLAATVTAQAGNLDTASVGGLVQRGGERLDATLDASRFTTDNRFENDDFDVTTLSGRLDARLPGRLSSTVTFRRSDAEGGTPGQVRIAPSLVNRQETEVTAVGVSASHRTASFWTQRLSLGLTEQDIEFESVFGSRSDSATRSVEWVHTLTPAGPVSLVLGGEYRIEDGEFEDTFGDEIDASLYTRALFAQAQVAAPGGRLFLQGGARLDDGTRLDAEVTPKAAAALLVEETGTRLHASWGRGIKGPTLIDLFFPGFSNPGLEPERLTGWDAGVDQALLGRRVELGVTVFRNDFEALIVFSPTLFVPVNVGKAHSYGVESTLVVRPLDWVDLDVSYTHLVAMDDDAERLLLRRPRNQGSARLTLRPLRAASVVVAGLYVGDRLDSTFAPGSQPEMQGSFFRLDTSASYRLPRVPGLRALELIGRVENVLDREYEEVAGFPALGTNVLAGVRGTF